VSNIHTNTSREPRRATSSRSPAQPARGRYPGRYHHRPASICNPAAGSAAVSGGGQGQPEPPSRDRQPSAHDLPFRSRQRLRLPAATAGRVPGLRRLESGDVPSCPPRATRVGKRRGRSSAPRGAPRRGRGSRGPSGSLIIAEGGPSARVRGVCAGHSDEWENGAATRDRPVACCRTEEHTWISSTSPSCHGRTRRMSGGCHPPAAHRTDRCRPAGERLSRTRQRRALRRARRAVGTPALSTCRLSAVSRSSGKKKYAW
jgi:hypothetical protein